MWESHGKPPDHFPRASWLFDILEKTSLQEASFRLLLPSEMGDVWVMGFSANRSKPLKPMVNSQFPC